MKRLAVCLLATLLPFGAGAADLQPWRNGTVTPTGDAGFLFMAEKHGFAAAQGIALTTTTVRGDPLLLKALIADQLDSYEGSPGSPMTAATRGAEVRAVACHWPKQNYDFWAKKGLAKVSDLKGHQVGVSAPGSSPDLFVRTALLESGITANQVSFVAAGTPTELLNSLGANVIDAAATPNEYRARATSMGLALLTTSEESATPFLRRCFYVSTETLAKRMDLLARFLAAEMNAYAYALSHRDEMMALSREMTHAPADAPEPGLAFDDAVSRHTIDPSFALPMDKFVWLNEILVKLGNIAPGYDPHKFVDGRAVEMARAIVAKGN